MQHAMTSALETAVAVLKRWSRPKAASAQLDALNGRINVMVVRDCDQARDRAKRDAQYSGTSF